MSSTEVWHRTVDATRRRSWAGRQVGTGDAAPLPEGVRAERSFDTTLPAATRAKIHPELAQGLIRAAEDVLTGRWTVLGVQRADSAMPDWFLDPVTGTRAPDQRLAFRIHHRDETETGNIKQVWEMSRHHHLTVLAGAWWLTQDDRYAEVVADQLRSWFTANPFLTGVHWTSGIEVAVRLIAWAWVRRLLDAWPKIGDLFEHNDDAVRQIAWHQEFLAAFPSRDSSANNHVIAEAAGQLVGACAFPWYAQSEKWRRDAASLLERELAANTFADGINRELASDYHRFVLELALVAAVESDAAGRSLTQETWTGLTLMLDAAAALTDSTGRPPRQGDGDEGRALVVDDPERNPWEAVLTSGGAVLGAASWWPPVSAGVQEVLVSALGRPRRFARPDELPRQFPDAGLTLLRSRGEDGPEIWCRCDGGPHGFLSIAAHAHADALSIEVRHDGIDILADPGTYCYHGEAKWRQWFRSTSAHNTVGLSQADQSESGGPFLWQTQARTTGLGSVIGHRPLQFWSAEHDGYRRLPSAGLHRRTVFLDSPARRLTVVDIIQTSAPTEAAVFWHLGPEVRVDVDGCRAQLSWRDGSDQRSGRLALADDLSWSAHRGESDPVQGWYSPRFGVRVPSTTLVGRTTVAGTRSILTTLELP